MMERTLQKTNKASSVPRLRPSGGFGLQGENVTIFKLFLLIPSLSSVSIGGESGFFLLKFLLPRVIKKLLCDFGSLFPKVECSELELLKKV